MKKKMLYYGDSPTARTGFGNVGRHTLSRLADQYEIDVLGINEFNVSWPSFPCRIRTAYSGDRDAIGQSKFVDMVLNQDEEWDIWFLHNDLNFFWWLPEVVAAVRAKGRNPYIFIHTVIDSPVSPLDIHSLVPADIIGIPSQYGINEVTKADPHIAYKLKYLPQGVDPKEFYPLPQQEIREIRAQSFRCTDKDFLIVNVNHNAERKDIARTLLYFSHLHQDRPNTALYLLLQPNEELNKGWNLDRVINTNREWMRGVRMSPEYNAVFSSFPVERVNATYNCADLVVSTSHAEGFGMYMVEAAAAGSLVMAPKHTSLMELIEKSGAIGAECGATKSEWTIEIHDPGFPRPLTNIDDMIKKTERVMDDRAMAEARATKAHEWAVKEMNWDYLVEKFWRPAIGSIPERRSLEGGYSI